MRFSPRSLGYLKSVALLILICFLVYFNSLKSPFQFDGVQYIQENPYIKSYSIFFDEFKISRLLLRSILVFTYTINYELGENDTLGYHLANLFIHFGVCLLIYLISSKASEHLVRNGFLSSCNSFPLLIALLFATHPVHSASVTYLMSRSASLVTFFYLGSFYSFMILLDIRVLSIPRSIKTTRIIFQVGMILAFALLGLGTKLIIVSLPLVMVIYFVFFFLPKGKPWPEFFQEEYKLIGSISGVFIIFLIYKAFFTKHGLFAVSGITQIEFSRLDYLLTQLKLLSFYYLKLFFFPLNLNVDPDIQVLESWFDLKLILSVVFLLILIIKVRAKPQNFLFGLCWFAVAMAPESSFIPLQDIVADHRLYLPSVGLFLILPFLLKKLYVRIMFCLVILIYSINLIDRNQDWRSQVSLWKDTVQKSPNKARPFINLAHAHHVSNDLEKAIINYKKAKALDTTYFEIHHNLGALYKEKGECETAEEEYRLALILKPDSEESMVGFAECSYQMGRYNVAILYLEKALKTKPRLASAYRILGKIYYFYLDKQELGKSYFRQALELDPYHEQNTIMKNIIEN